MVATNFQAHDASSNLVVRFVAGSRGNAGPDTRVPGSAAPALPPERRFLGHLLTVLGLATLTAAIVLLAGPEPAKSSEIGQRSAIATWFGPSFYYHRTACGETYFPNLRGVAHRTLPCGTWLVISYRGRRVRVQVVDRGPYSFATFDLTARTAEDLCRCARPFTMRVAYRRG